MTTAQFRPASEREGYIEEIASALRSGHGVLVLGDAGVGKSHLVTTALLRTGHEADLVLPDTLAEPVDAAGSGVLDRLAEFRGRLATAPDGQAPILRVEDAHLFDPAGAEAVAALAHAGEVRCVITARTVAGATSPWHELWRDGVLERIDVHQLSVTEVEAMLVADLGGPVLTDTVHSIWAETGGNAFHVRELAADQRAEGRLTEREGVWVLHGPPVVGERVLDVVRADMAGLSAEVAETLDLLALLGPQTLSVLLDVVEQDAVAELLTRGLIRTVTEAETPEVRVEVAHRLYSSAVGSAIPRSRRRELLQRAVSLAGGAGFSTPQSVRLALAEGVSLTAAHVRAAVTDALEHGRHEEAVAIAGQALELPDVVGIDAVALLTLRADGHRLLAAPDHALADIAVATERLRGIAEAEPGHPEIAALIADLTKLRADIEQYQHDDVDAALAALAEGAAWASVLPTPDSARIEQALQVSQLTRLGYAGRHRQAQEDALRLLETAKEPHRMTVLVCPTALGLLQSGRFDDVSRLLRKFQPVLAHPQSHREAASELAIVGFLSQLWAGEITALEGMMGTGLPVGHSAIQWAGAHLSRGLVAAARGSWSASRTELHAANVRFAVSDSGGTAPYALATEALAAAATGDEAAARTLLATLAAMPRRATAVLESELRLLRLDTLIWLDDANAVGEARALADWAAEAGAARARLEALHRLAVLSARAVGSADPELMTQIATGAAVRSARGAALVQHVSALTSGDADLAGIAVRELNRRGLWLPPAARARGLTSREREIAALAGSGLTSRLIADRLGLSARTVDSHLSHAFTKLGVRSREELSGALG